MPRTQKFFTIIHSARGKVIHIGCGALSGGPSSPTLNNFARRISNEATSQKRRKEVYSISLSGQ